MNKDTKLTFGLAIFVAALGAMFFMFDKQSDAGQASVASTVSVIEPAAGDEGMDVSVDENGDVSVDMGDMSVDTSADGDVSVDMNGMEVDTGDVEYSSGDMMEHEDMMEYSSGDDMMMENDMDSPDEGMDNDMEEPAAEQ